MHQRFAGVALLVCVADSLVAQNAPSRDTVASLPTVTVTASRSPTNILTTPLAITKVTAPALRAVNGWGLEDALTFVPGVIAQSRYGTSDFRLSIRGFGARGASERSNPGVSRGVKILIDGFPESEPDGRTAFDQVDLATADAVEVVRSNESAVYGNAAGGVINIITVPHAVRPSFDVQPIVGSFGLRRYVARASAPMESGIAFASVTNSTFEGWREHSDARRVVFNGGLVGTVPGKTQLGVYLTAANNLMHLPGPLTEIQLSDDRMQANPSYVSHDERRFDRVGRLGVTIDHTIDTSTSISSMFYLNPKYLERSERNTFEDFTRVHLGGNVVGRTRMTLGRTVSHWSIGLDEAYEDGAISVYSLLNGTRGPAITDDKGEGVNTLGVFVQDAVAVNDRLNLLLGTRYDVLSYYYRSFLAAAPTRFDSRRFSGVSPTVGFSWSINSNQSFYGNVGRGIEAPAGNEVDPSPGPIASSPGLLNHLLDPMRSTNIELGFKSTETPAAGSDALTYDIALYNIETHNELIPYSQGRYYASAATARRTGLEIGSTLETVDGFLAAAAFTFSKNKYVNYFVDPAVNNPSSTASKTNRSGNDIVGIPSIVANVEIGLNLPTYPNLRLKAALEHSGKYFADDANAVTVPSYSIVNWTAELRNPLVAANGWGLRGFVSVHNMANAKYIGSAYLNPDPIGAGHSAFEPGMPRSLIVSLVAGRYR